MSESKLPRDEERAATAPARSPDELIKDLKIVPETEQRAVVGGDFRHYKINWGYPIRDT